MLQESQKMRRRSRVYNKIFEEIVAGNFPNMVKDRNKDSRSSISPKHDKFKDIHTQKHHNQTAKL